MTVSNIQALGVKQAAGYADSLLGTIAEFSDIDLNQTTLGPKATKSGGKVVAILVKSANASTMAPGSLVKFSVPGTVVDSQTGAAGVVDGVVDPYLTDAVALNDKFWIIVAGIAPVLSGAAYSINAALASDASGKAVSATSGTVTNFARAVEAATASGQLKRAFIQCRPI